MHYAGNKKEIVWHGKTEVVHNRCVVLCEDEKGEFKHLMLDTGGLVPENWIGEKIKITIEKL